MSFSFHLVYTLRCRDEGIVPPSLSLKAPINTRNAKSIIDKAQRSLVRQRIRLLNNKVKFLRLESESKQTELFGILPSHIHSEISCHLDNSCESEFERVKWRPNQKFDKQMMQVKKFAEKEPDLSGTQIKKWVVNLSQHKLNENQNNVLAKGLNFAVSPDHMPTSHYIVATEQASWHLPPDHWILTHMDANPGIRVGS